MLQEMILDHLMIAEFLEVANLSLDKLELEGVFFNDDDDLLDLEGERPQIYEIS